MVQQLMLEDRMVKVKGDSNRVSGLNDREDETFLEVFARKRLKNPGNREE